MSPSSDTPDSSDLQQTLQKPVNDPEPLKERTWAHYLTYAVDKRFTWWFNFIFDGWADVPETQLFV